MNDGLNIINHETSIKEIAQKVKQIGNYIIGSELGTGAFAQVVLGTHDITGESVAIKILDKIKLSKSPENFELIRQEIEILKIVRHKNIVQLYDILETPRHIYIIMEFCEGKDLMDYIITRNHLSELESLRLFQELIHALSYLHIQNITHRDVKIDNMLLDSKRSLKLADFGLSTKYPNDDLLRQPCGTVVYAAPEILEGHEYHGMLADVWSSGIVLYGMLAGYLPFCDDDDEINKTNVIKGQFEIPDTFSPMVIDLIQHMLDRNPLTRYTIFEIQEHAWFKSLESVPLPGIIIGKHKIPIDENIISKIELYGFDIHSVKSSLRKNKCDSGTALYYLLVRQAYKKGHYCISDLSSAIFLEYINNKRNRLDYRTEERNDSAFLNETRDTNRKISQTLSEEEKNGKKENYDQISKTKKSKKSNSIRNLSKIGNYFNNGRSLVNLNNQPLTERRTTMKSREKNKNNVLLSSIMTKPSETSRKEIKNLPPRKEPLVWKPLLSDPKSKSRNRTVFQKTNQEDTFAASNSLSQKSLINKIPKLQLTQKLNESDLLASLTKSSKTIHNITQRNDNNTSYQASSQQQQNSQTHRSMNAYKEKPKITTRNEVFHTNRHLESSVIVFREITPNQPRDLSYSIEKCFMNKSKRLEKMPWKYKKKGIDFQKEKEIYDKYQKIVLNNKKVLKKKRQSDGNLSSKQQEKYQQTHQNIHVISQQNQTHHSHRNIHLLSQQNQTQNSQQNIHVLSQQNQTQYSHKNIHRPCQTQRNYSHNHSNSQSHKSQFREHTHSLNHKNTPHIEYNHIPTPLDNVILNQIHNQHLAETVKRQNFKKRIYSASLTNISKTIETKYYMTLNDKDIPVYEGPIDFLCLTYDTIDHVHKTLIDKLRENKICYVQTRYNKFMCTKMGQCCDIEIVKLMMGKPRHTIIPYDDKRSEGTKMNLYLKIRMKKGRVSSYQTFVKLLLG